MNFENFYPEKVLHEWTALYTPFINDYFQKKQQVSKPIQIEITPVVISPPSGITLSDIDRSALVQAEIIKQGLQKSSKKDFQTFVISPVHLGGSGGWYGLSLDSKDLIYAPLGGNVPYTAGDQEKIFMVLLAFEDTFQVISHELLHSFGLNGDHVPMGIRPHASPDEQSRRGEKIAPESEYDLCELSSISPEYYFVDPPKELTIEVGKEPPWAHSAALHAFGAVF